MNKFCFFIALFGFAGSMYSQNFNYPKTDKIPFDVSQHGYKLNDNYQWLEDKNDPKVKEWSHTQHNFTVDFIKNTGKEVAGLKDELRAYFDREYRSAPFFVGKREFFYSKKKGQQFNVLYTKLNGKEIKLFDPMDVDTSGKSSWNVNSPAVFTEKGDKVAVGVQYKGNEIADYRIIDTETGKIGTEVIKGLREFAWAKDENYAYLVLRTQEMIDKQTPLPIYKHKMGTDRSKDEFLFAPKDAKNWSLVYDSKDADYTFYSDGDFYSRTIQMKKIGTTGEPIEIFSSKEFNAEPEIKDGKLYIFTNENAPNFKVMVADLANPQHSNWKTFLAEKPDAVLEGYAITPNYFITQEKEDVLSKLKAYSRDGKFVKEITLPEFGDVGGLSFNKEQNCLYVTINTFTSPSILYKLDANKLTWERVWQDNPPINTDGIESKMVKYKSKDGTMVPLFLVYKKGIKLDGTNPTLLYGYGGFNISMQPSYLGDIASFVRRGGVYAVACLRGGNEYGENWHKAGMLKNKQNVFDDFIAAAEYLIAEKYTNPTKLACSGRSNGGLLVGATITQRPDLFRASICGVALLDMLRYHKFLIARYWIPEYGDPDKKEDYDYIKTYSPTHNVRENKQYPATLITAGENDSRVDALHAKKFAAELQALPNQKNPILLFVDFDAGHGSGGSGQSVEKRIENKYLEWKFLFNNLGLE